MATSISQTNIASDENEDDEEYLLRTEIDEQSRRNSNESAMTNLTITKTSGAFYSSDQSSEMNLPMSSLSMVAVSSKQSLAVPHDTHPEKSKNGVKKFFRKFFGSSHQRGTAVTAAKPVRIDRVHRTAYAPMSPLPITQGPIRLFVIRHGERLDRFYSPLWVQQAFDKEGNFCRFSPILP